MGVDRIDVELSRWNIAQRTNVLRFVPDTHRKLSQ